MWIILQICQSHPMYDLMKTLALSIIPAIFQASFMPAARPYARWDGNWGMAQGNTYHFNMEQN